jgi:hypothetical protein
VRGYSYGVGVNYARFVRRGDARALGLFLMEQIDLLRPPLSRLIRLRRPTGLKNYIAHTQGFFRGPSCPAAPGLQLAAESVNRNFVKADRSSASSRPPHGATTLPPSTSSMRPRAMTSPSRSFRPPSPRRFSPRPDAESKRKVDPLASTLQ